MFVFTFDALPYCRCNEIVYACIHALYRTIAHGPEDSWGPRIFSPRIGVVCLLTAKKRIPEKSILFNKLCGPTPEK
jgi:hypothetical protein